ncbi:MAG: hypothetical protein OEZ38_08755 [Gammaproteobacteria bacterium]|nr:hypothetical protein [Gammaproteobacteria bacterium]
MELNRSDILELFFKNEYKLNTNYVDEAHGLISENYILDYVLPIKQSYNVDMIDLTIQRGANIDTMSPVNGLTAVLNASIERLFFPRHNLLPLYADANLLNNDVESALLLVAKSPASQDCSISQCNLTIEDYVISKMLLEHNADPNVATKTGQTPLMFFAPKGEPKSIKHLIHWGSDINVVDSNERKHWIIALTIIITLNHCSINHS